MVTVLIAFGSMLIAVVLGMPLAIGQSKGPRWLQWLCTIYIEFFRGTPVLVQLLFLYFGLPTIGLAMPGWLTEQIRCFPLSARNRLQRSAINLRFVCGIVEKHLICSA